MWKWNCHGLENTKHFSVENSDLFMTLVLLFCPRSSRNAVMPLITRLCLNLIHKKDKTINNGCFVVIPVINIVWSCLWVCACVIACFHNQTCQPASWMILCSISWLSINVLYRPDFIDLSFVSVITWWWRYCYWGLCVCVCECVCVCARVCC